MFNNVLSKMLEIVKSCYKCLCYYNKVFSWYDIELPILIYTLRTIKFINTEGKVITFSSTKYDVYNNFEYLSEFICITNTYKIFQKQLTIKNLPEDMCGGSF